MLCITRPSRPGTDGSVRALGLYIRIPLCVGPLFIRLVVLPAE